MSCADPETFVWRAGYYWPYSGFAIEMAFRCPADCGQTLNADFVALRVLVGSEPVLLRNPIVLWFPMGPHPPPPLLTRAWMYSNPENFTLIDDIPSMWHSSTNKSHVSNIYWSRGEEWVSGHPTYTDKHIHMRARVLADHKDVGLLRNTGIDPLPPPPPPPPPPPTIQKAVQPALFCPPAKHLVRSPWSNNLDPRMQLFYPYSL